MRFNFKKSVCFFIILFLPSLALATDFSGDSFKVRDPVLNSGEYGTSASFKLFGSISEISIGTSTASTFNDSAGFLYFPFASAPVADATAGDSKVELSWSVSTGASGWTVSGYNVGQSTVSDGPYTYGSNVGSTTSTTMTGLSNGTKYYFIVRAQDAFGNSIATSSEVSATPAAPVSTPAPGGGILESLLKILVFPEPITEGSVIPPRKAGCLTADLNCDGAVNVQDLSIILALQVKGEKIRIDLNKDGAVDFGDYSVLIYEWTNKLAYPTEELPAEIEKRSLTFKEPPPSAGTAFIGGELEETRPSVVFTAYNSVYNFIRGIITGFVNFFVLFWSILTY